MKKITILLAVAFLGSISFVNAQSLDKVLDNYFETIGQEVLVKSQNYSTTGKIVQMGMEIPFVQYAAKPNKFRVEATLQGMTMIQAYNGEKGEAIVPFAGQTEPQPMSELEMKSMKMQADYDGFLWNWKEKGYTVTLEDNEEVDGADCFVVKIITPDKDEIQMFLDAESYVPVQTKSKTEMQGQMINSQTVMSNYQEIDGHVYAAKVESYANGQLQMTMILEKMEFDIDLDEKIFDAAK